MNILMSIFIVVIVSLIPIASYSSDIPNLHEVTVKGFVSFNNITGSYNYSYELNNSSQSTGNIDEIELDISIPDNAKRFSQEGLVIEVGYDPDGNKLIKSLSEELRFMKDTLEKIVVPVGVQTPRGWIGGITVDGFVMWGGVDPSSFIYPGTSSYGFLINSAGYPVIRNVKISPTWILSVDRPASDEDVEYAKGVKEKITYITKTIGPTAPPIELIPADFIDNIINMKHEAFALGWITDKAIEHSLDVKLDNAKKKIAQGNLNAAIQVLKAFINEVEAQGCESYEQKCPPGKHLKPEAYAILKYNAQYLVDNMK